MKQMAFNELPFVPLQQRVETNVFFAGLGGRLLI